MGGAYETPLLADKLRGRYYNHLNTYPKVTGTASLAINATAATQAAASSATQLNTLAPREDRAWIRLLARMTSAPQFDI